MRRRQTVCLVVGCGRCTGGGHWLFRFDVRLAGQVLQSVQVQIVEQAGVGWLLSKQFAVDL